jgi:protein-disulfide isomerase
MKKTLVVAMMFGLVMSGAVAQQQAAIPAAPAVKDKPFPPVNPKNFTAASPTPAEVDSFLKALWGYDENRIWQVAGIEKTAAPGVAKVTVFVEDKTQPGKGATTMFFTTPDGKHAIAGQEVVAFGAKPFADTRVLMEQQANGPSHGAKSKDLELVEFADLQCPHCKSAQDTMDQLATDFPQAHIVFENYPISEIHPYAFEAAAEGVCVRKAQGDEAFFVYAKTVFDTQGALTADSHQATLDSAVMREGADPKAVAACAATPAVKEQVEAERKLGEEIGVSQTPMLVVNGHVLPVSEIPYETLKKIVAYQAGQDGVQVKLQPTLSNLK